MDEVDKLVEKVLKILDTEYIGDNDKDASDEHHRQAMKQILFGNNLAIIVDKELPKMSKVYGDKYLPYYGMALDDMLNAGYKPIIPLEESK